jgi:hypothetical protein
MNPETLSAMKEACAKEVAWGDSRLPQRFWSKTSIQADGCWRWVAATTRGYGSYRHNNRLTQAHRAAYTVLVGPIPGTSPAGLTVDHLCRNRSCVNPAHMELVSRGENTMRGDSLTAKNKQKTHCSRGHEYTLANTYLPSDGKRYCRACNRIRNKEYCKRHPSYSAEYGKRRRARERAMTTDLAHSKGSEGRG